MSNTDQGPLAGLRVLDLSRILAGPYCGMILGDLGAEVIKIEAPAGDDTRHWGPPYIGSESAYFLGFNRNKRSIVLDFSTEIGRGALAALMRGSDVLIENFKSGTMERWGFGEDWFSTNAPSLVRASITGYGNSGSRKSSPGYDFVLQAESGLMSICGDLDGEPTKYGVAVVDLATGMLSTIGILSALQERNRSGLGQRVDASLLESSLALLANVASNVMATGRDAGRFGNGHPNIVPYRTYKMSDGYIALAIGNDQQFQRFASLAQQEVWATDPRFSTNSARVENRQLVDREVGKVLLNGTVEEWLTNLREAGVPCGRVNTVSTALNDPQTAARDMIQEIEHKHIGLIKTLGIPVKLSRTPGTIRTAPPMLGEHTEEVLHELFPDEPSRIAALVQNAKGKK